MPPPRVGSRCRALLASVLLLLGVALTAAPGLGAPSARAAALPDPPVLRRWIEGFARSPRGPFEGIRWFCADGSVRPARAGCAGHGGGVQHGAWSPRARALRDGGYAVANVLVALEPEHFVGRDADLDAWRQLLLERFLVDFDEGWIYRSAWGYRGAFQIEDEEAAAHRLLLALLADPRWRDPDRFLLLRESVRLLPLAVAADSAAAARTRAVHLAERDPGFAALRAKLHGFPDSGDAARVRSYAAERGRRGLTTEYEALARDLDALYAPRGAAPAVRALVPETGGWCARRRLRKEVDRLEAARDPAQRVAAAAGLMRRLRDAFPGVEEPEAALDLLRASLALERELYAAAGDLASRLGDASRGARLRVLATDADALYGAGLLDERERKTVEQTVERVDRGRPRLRAYRDALRTLERVPEWSARRLRFALGPAIERWAPLEPLAGQYVPDRLRGSPALLYGRVLDGLAVDADRLAGIEHELFGKRVGAGLRALNPGLSRGLLRRSDDGLRPDGIYLLPETWPDLVPVAGILTRGEGSALSHVQLLARNLGIPNVRVGDALLPRVEAHLGERVVLAVSPGGVVRLSADGPAWQGVFADGAEAPPRAPLEPDLARLDLDTTELLPLGRLSAADAGRVCGPKGANLGALRHAFGDRVPDGFVIPFGVFRRVLEQPIAPGGPSAFAWMQARYGAIEAAAGEPARQQRLLASTLARLRRWIEERAVLGPELEAALRAGLARLGGERTGVFVRSDTNVEDLPGFTGAGLNRTVPNVVGFDAVERAIRAVWASPFTERAWAWRQARMADPEWVLPAVVVQRAFAAQKSGVMATLDVDTGDRGWLSIATNEGVGGAVAGQDAESLRVDLRSGRARLLEPAAEPRRIVLAAAGGVLREPASGAGSVLHADEIDALVRLARALPEKLPALRDPATGGVLPVDVEFAFRDGELALLQIRPFNESPEARRSRTLAALDAPLAAREDVRVPMDQAPARR